MFWSGGLVRKKNLRRLFLREVEEEVVEDEEEEDEEEEFELEVEFFVFKRKGGCFVKSDFKV